MPFHQNTVRARASQGFIGQLAFAAALSYLVTMINSAPQARQTQTVTIDTATLGAPYTVTINGIDVTFTAVGGTKALIAAELAAAINAEPLVRGRVKAASDGVDTVTLTALSPGLAFTFSESDAKLSTATGTANDTADAVPVGRAVTSEGINPGTDGDLSTPDTDTQLGHIAAASLMSAYVQTWTGASIASGDTSYAVIDVAGDRYVIPAAFDTNNDASVAALATAINAAMPANTVIAAAASGVLTLTAEVAGQAFEANVYATGSGGGAYTATDAAHPTIAESFWDGFGVSVRGYDEEAQADGTFAYPGNAGMRVLTQGAIWVEHNAAAGSEPATGDDVFIYVGATAADQGKFYNAAGTDRIKVPRDLARWRGLTDRDGSLALIELRPRGI